MVCDLSCCHNYGFAVIFALSLRIFKCNADLISIRILTRWLKEISGDKCDVQQNARRQTRCKNDHDDANDVQIDGGELAAIYSRVSGVYGRRPCRCASVVVVMYSSVDSVCRCRQRCEWNNFRLHVSMSCAHATERLGITNSLLEADKPHTQSAAKATRNAITHI